MKENSKEKTIMTIDHSRRKEAGSSLIKTSR
jgi:hypothetical protein